MTPQRRCHLTSERFHSFIAKSRGIPWSFGWGICFPLACIHSIEICAVACFPATAFREGGELKYRIPYLVVCFTLTLLTLLLSKQLVSHDLLLS